jgi:MFS family permease
MEQSSLEPSYTRGREPSVQVHARDDSAHSPAPRVLWPTYTIAAAHGTASAAMTPLVPLWASANGASPAMVGVVAGASAVLPLILGVWAGASTDVLGVRRMVQVAAVVHALSAVLIGAASSVSLIILGAAIAGMAVNIMVIAAQTSVAHLGRPAQRDRNYGLFAFWMSVGQLLGPLASGFIADAFSIPIAFFACALLAGSPFLWAFRIVRPAGQPEPDEPLRLLRAYDAYRAAWALTRRRDLRFILIIAFLIIFGWSIKASFLPLYLQSVGMPKAQIGLIFSLMGVGSMLVRPFLGALADRFGRSPVLLGAVLLGASVIAAIPLLRDFLPLAAVAVAGGLAWGITQPLTISLMAGSVTLRERGLALSLRITSNRLGEVASPLLFGVLVTWTSIGGAFLLAAGVLAVSVIVIGRSARSGAFTPMADTHGIAG